MNTVRPASSDTQQTWGPAYSESEAVGSNPTGWSLTQLLTPDARRTISHYTE
jgi:hypothetical protein